MRPQRLHPFYCFNEVIHIREAFIWRFLEMCCSFAAHYKILFMNKIYD